MNATKLYIVMKAICNIALTIGIIFATCYLQSWALLFFLILPACGMGLEVTSSPQGGNKIDKNKESENLK